jgi:hypothetical protein
MHLGFLQAEEVGIQTIECFFKSFSATGSEAVDIP